MRSMPVVLTETENKNDSVNQNDVGKMTSQCRMETSCCTLDKSFIQKVLSIEGGNRIYIVTKISLFE